MDEELPQEQKPIIPSAQSVDAIKTLPGIHIFWETIFWPGFDVMFPFTMKPFCSNKAEKFFGFIHFFSFSSAEWGHQPCHDPKTSLQMTLHPHHHSVYRFIRSYLRNAVIYWMMWMSWCENTEEGLMKGDWREKTRKFMTDRQTDRQNHTRFWLRRMKENIS